MTRPTPLMVEVRDDFDRIARIADESWGHNGHYHAFLLRQLPGLCEAVLEVGCGTGSFARLLARHADEVLALDLSPEMIRVARERAARNRNIVFEVSDVMNRQLPADRFDAVISIATLHHLPFGEILSRLSASLKPGGKLVVLDLYDRTGPTDILFGMVAIPASCGWRLVKCGRLREPAEVRKIWAEHGKRDTYMTLDEIRGVATQLLPGSLVRRHLFWRYSLVWQKPVAN